MSYNMPLKKKKEKKEKYKIQPCASFILLQAMNEHQYNS